MPEANHADHMRSQEQKLDIPMSWLAIIFELDTLFKAIHSAIPLFTCFSDGLGNLMSVSQALKRSAVGSPGGCSPSHGVTW